MFVEKESLPSTEWCLSRQELENNAAQRPQVRAAQSAKQYVREMIMMCARTGLC